MAWKVEIEGPAEKELKKLDRPVAKRILKFLFERVATLDNPRVIGEPLHGPLSAYWKYRVGDYRIIANIQDQEIRILILSVGHRSDVYRL